MKDVQSLLIPINPVGRFLVLISSTVPSGLSASPPLVSVTGSKPRRRAEAHCWENSASYPGQAIWTTLVLAAGNCTGWEEHLVWLKATTEVTPKYQVDTT